MRSFVYSVIAVVADQQLKVCNYTREQFEKLVEMIYSCGGWLVEYTVTEVMV